MHRHFRQDFERHRRGSRRNEQTTLMQRVESLGARKCLGSAKYTNCLSVAPSTHHPTKPHQKYNEHGRDACMASDTRRNEVSTRLVSTRHNLQDLLMQVEPKCQRHTRAPPNQCRRGVWKEQHGRWIPRIAMNVANNLPIPHDYDNPTTSARQNNRYDQGSRPKRRRHQRRRRHATHPHSRN